MNSIFFIDDDALMLRIITDKLKKRTIYTCRDVAGCQALLTAGHKPAWVICDYFLEHGETALDVLQLIRRQGLNQTRFVCITANSTLKEIESCRGQFDAIIEKATPQFF